MTPERYQQVKRVFMEACELAPAERAEHLDRMCAGDAELRAEVEALLASDGGALPVRPRVSAASVLADLADRKGDRRAEVAAYGRSDVRLPQRIGRYSVLGLLGEGGMGTVYLAEQEHPRRKVALKVLRAGSTSREMLRRFEHEASILGQLSHPGIAHIHEAGVAHVQMGEGFAAKCPFFAMEYVQGESLDKYIERLKLPVPQRLALLVSICDAVHHAHQKGVIHRDLKPSNILVNEQDEPKILDFGIARATDADIQTVTMQTAVGQLVGTIPYMSPEQVTGVSANVDTRSDVYALGVICYEVLTGNLPHAVKDRSIPEAVRIIREEEPTRLSSVDTLFRGDLDTIVLKALEKDKERRYQSASEFAADLCNYLDNRPIAARPPTTIYQLRMFARRNKTLVGGILATFVALLIGITGIAVQAVRVTWQRDLAMRAEQLAARRAYAANIAAAYAAWRANDVAIARQRLKAASPHLRNWEWRYLARRLDCSLARFASHEQYVWSVTYGPDGSWLASGSADETVRLWDAVSGNVLRTMSAGGRVQGVAVSPDGHTVVAATQNGLLSVWDIPTGDRVMTLSSEAGDVKDIAFSPNGALIASGSSDGTARIWDARTGRLIAVLDHPDWVQGVCFTPDSARLATSCRDNVARLWDLSTRVPVLEIAVLPSTREWTFVHSWAVTIDPEGQILAAGGHDGVIKLFSTTTGGVQKALSGHTNRVRSLVFSPDGARLASASDDGTVRIWSPASGVEITTLLGHEGAVYDVDFSPDGKRLVSSGADRSIHVWHARSTPQSSRLRGHENRGIWALDSSPDGKQIVSAGGDATVRLWDVESGVCTGVMRGHEDWVLAVVFSPDGKQVASGSRDGTVRLWQVDTCGELATLSSHDDAVWSVAFSPGGERVASASLDGTIKLWDLGTPGKPVTITSEMNEFTALAFSPDGTQLASGSDAGLIELWDVRTVRRSGVVDGHEDRVWTVAYSPDGTQLMSASADHTLKLWDPRTGELAKTLEGHTGIVRAGVFSPDGTRIASVSHDQSLRLWDLYTAETVLSFRAHTGWPTALAFSHDGTWLASAGASIRLWEATTPSWRDVDRRWARIAAEELVDRLFATARNGAKVTALIESDETIDDEVRHYALQVARSRAVEHRDASD